MQVSMGAAASELNEEVRRHVIEQNLKTRDPEAIQLFVFGFGQNIVFNRLGSPRGPAVRRGLCRGRHFFGLPKLISRQHLNRSLYCTVHTVVI